jgi:hypothetical protein
MAFVDLHPHESSQPDHRVDGLTNEDGSHEIDGAVYRAFFRAMPIAGLPAELRIGHVSIFQTAGPIRSQKTRVRQQPGLKLHFDKELTTAVLVGEGEWLTVAQLEVDPTADPSTAFASWRATVTEAVGLLATMLDERVALELLSEDLIQLVDGQPVQSADIRTNVRSFLPYEVRDSELEAIRALTMARNDLPNEVHAAARWYLKGAQAGPVADAIIYFWIALEALTPGETQSIKSLETMLLEAGWDMQNTDPELGRMSGLRADIVHDAVEDPASIREGFYRLEAAVRALIRRRIGLFTSWPPATGLPTFVTHASEISASWANPTVEWHDVMPPSAGAVPTSDLDWDLMMGPPLTHGLDIEVDSALPRFWDLKIQIYAALAVRTLGDRFDNAPVRIVVEDFPDDAPSSVRVNNEQISLAKSSFKKKDRHAEPRLAQAVFGLVPVQQLMRQGVDTDVPYGAYLLEAAAGFCQFHAFVVTGFVDPDEVGYVANLAPDALKNAGELCGAALAGGERARSILDAWLGDPTVDADMKALTISLLEAKPPETPAAALDFFLYAWENRSPSS